MDRLAKISVMMAQAIAEVEPGEMLDESGTALRMDFPIVEGGDAGLSWNAERGLWVLSLRRMPEGSKDRQEQFMRHVLSSCATAPGRGDIAGLDAEGRLEVWTMLPRTAGLVQVETCHARLLDHLATGADAVATDSAMSSDNFAWIRL